MWQLQAGRNVRSGMPALQRNPTSPPEKEMGFTLETNGGDAGTTDDSRRKKKKRVDLIASLI